jgi:hypothetical protein
VDHPIHRIMLRTDEFVDLISVEKNYGACIVKAQPRPHSAIVGAGEYYRHLVEGENMSKKTWHKISLAC